MDRIDVYRIIDGERSYQKANGRAEHRTIGEWLDTLYTYMTQSYQTPEGRLHVLRKIAAVAVAMLEDHDCPPREGYVPTLNNEPIYTNERIGDIVDNHIFLDNWTASYKIYEDRADKYLREMRDTYEKQIAFWQMYGTRKNLELLEARHKGGQS